MATIYPITCAHCSRAVAAEVKAGGGTVSHPAEIFWLQCPNCGDGSVRTRDGAVYPPAPAGGTVAGLPDDVERAWREARTAHAVAAYTASEIMCRKILMHVAVDAAGSQPNKKFVEYINDLESSGYITTGLKPAIDSVRARGNIANHDLPASTEQDALTTLTITEYLLRGIYELPGLVP